MYELRPSDENNPRYSIFFLYVFSLGAMIDLSIDASRGGPPHARYSTLHVAGRPRRIIRFFRNTDSFKNTFETLPRADDFDTTDGNGIDCRRAASARLAGTVPRS